MGEKILKWAIFVAVVFAVLWAFASFTGNAITIGSAKKKCQLQRRRRVNGQLWQPAGVVGPFNVLSAYSVPPLAPVNPY